MTENKTTAIVPLSSTLRAVAEDLTSGAPLAGERIAARWLMQAASTIEQLLDRCNGLSEEIAAIKERAGE